MESRNLLPQNKNVFGNVDYFKKRQTLQRKSHFVNPSITLSLRRL